MIGLSAVPTLIQLICMIFVQESPFTLAKQVYFVVPKIFCSSFTALGYNYLLGLMNYTFDLLLLKIYF